VARRVVTEAFRPAEKRHLIGVVLPGQGPILLEVGHFIVDARTGAVLFEAGRHDTLDRDTAAFCAYFAA
jgi:hypothetical protein